MHRLIPLLVSLLFCLPFSGAAQEIYLSRWVPGTFDGANNLGSVELYNPSGRIVDLSGYLVATRTFAVRLPANTRIRPKSSLLIARGRSAGRKPDVDLATTNDFLINFPTENLIGNYLVLYDADIQLIDAVYFSPVPIVPFIPESRTLYPMKGEKVVFRVPSENSAAWAYITIGMDPAIAFSRINKSWRVTAVKRNLSPATEYQNMTLRYRDGIVTVKWTTRMEEECFEHIVERSPDLRNFEEIGTIKAKGNSTEFQQYVFYDNAVEEGEKYFYRIKNEDKFRNLIYSNISEIEAEDIREAFSWDLYFSKSQPSRELNIRFLSRYPTKVRIKIVDEKYREIGVVFNDFVYAETQNLLKVTEPLDPGNYLVIFETVDKRYFKEFSIGGKGSN